MYESVKLKNIQSSVLKAMAEGPMWSKPWAESMQENALTKKSYRGVNALYLSLADKTSYEWSTDKRAKQVDPTVKPFGQLTKGRSQTSLLFFKNSV